VHHLPLAVEAHHATRDLSDDRARVDVARALKRAAAARGIGWLAFADGTRRHPSANASCVWPPSSSASTLLGASIPMPWS